MLQRLPSELWQAAFGSTNAGSNAIGAGLLLDSLRHSLPLAWRVKLAGGTWELFDANAASRKYAWGKKAKVRIKPRIGLRAHGARLEWLAGARMKGDEIRVAGAAGAKTVAEALRVSKSNTMRMIPKAIFDKLPKRALVGGNVVGLALTVLPQLAHDASESGLLAKPTDADAWKSFAVAEAKSQSANLFGFAASAGVGAALVLAGVSTAPVLLLVGLAVGIGAQAGFNALGLSDRAEEAAASLFSS